MHTRCTAYHRRTRPDHCTHCGKAWPCREALLVEVDRLRTELVDAATVRLRLEDQLTAATRDLAVAEEALAGMRCWVPVDQHGGSDG